MDFNKNKTNKIGEIIGYFIMYIIFTVVLYFILKLTDKLPQSFTSFHISLIPLAIVLTSKLISLLLK